MTLYRDQRLRTTVTPAESGRSRHGFTLVELLVVMGIIIVLIGLLAPSVGTMVRGPLVTQAADKLVGLFNQAQQAATARNQPVEVRFYQYGDPSVTGESVGNPGSGKFRALQLLIVGENGAVTPLGAVETLPAGIIMDSGLALSTLLGTATQKKTWTVADPQVSLPRPGTSYNCSKFRFRPDGSTDLAPGNWFVTVYNMKEGDARTAPPPNYATIQIDPINGASTVYRP